MNQRAELARLIDRHVTEDGVHKTQIPRLSLIRASHPTEPLHVLHEPALCIIAQGSKRVLLGDDAQGRLVEHVQGLGRARRPDQGQARDPRPMDAVFRGVSADQRSKLVSSVHSP